MYASGPSGPFESMSPAKWATGIVTTGKRVAHGAT